MENFGDQNTGATLHEVLCKFSVIMVSLLIELACWKKSCKVAPVTKDANIYDIVMEAIDKVRIGCEIVISV